MHNNVVLNFMCYKLKVYYDVKYIWMICGKRIQMNERKWMNKKVNEQKKQCVKSNWACQSPDFKQNRPKKRSVF